MSDFFRNRKGKRFLQIFSAFIVIATLLCAGSIEAFAKTQNDLENGKTYSVPVESLTSKAPLKPINTAFSKAFGDSITVTVDENGNKTAKVKNHHMVIDIGPLGTGTYESNICTVKDATIISTKTENFSNPKDGLRNPSVTESVEVPDEFTFSLNTDEKSEQVLTITVDFMNAFLGGGEPYETDVTLKLNFDTATEVTNKDTTTKAETQNKDSSASNNELSGMEKVKSALTDMKLLENNKPTSLTYIIGAALVVAIVLIVIIVRKNRV